MNRVFFCWAVVGVACLVGLTTRSRAQSRDAPAFELVQPDVFGRSGGQLNCWGDFDNDGDLDLFVGFKAGVPNRLYRNDRGRFTDVAVEVGVADLTDTRAAAWGDFNGDGHLDLYVGFTRRSDIPNKLYRSDGNGKPFTEVGHQMGVDPKGETRQPAWIDFDRDGDVDLFVAIRDAPNLLFRNDGDHFTSVGEAMGVADPRRTVGAVWFDADQDGDLDLALANNNPEGVNSLYRNLLPSDRAHRSVQVVVLDRRGRHTQAGSEVRIYAAGSRKGLGTAIVDTGSGYCSQNAAPVHFGLPSYDRVDIEVTSLTSTARKITRVAGVVPDKARGRIVVVKTD
jgi:hypothetical protein